MERHDTIAAIATAPGRAGVAIVRISGPDAFRIAETLSGTLPEPGRFRLSEIRDGAAATIDRAIVLAFGAPRSYTGEDVAEIQCHGGQVTPRRILEACLAAGARLARRGEFTERAFLNGKIDYSQAESVLDLINAKTERAADAALSGMEGKARRKARELYESALELSTTLEYALDVSEDELPPSFAESVADRASALDACLGSAIRQARENKLLRSGALVVLAGAPNAGKSSLMNALLGENRAIVSERPGTTRDSIEEWLDIDGYPVRLVDTAGMRSTEDAIEAEGVRRTEELVAKADIVLLLTPADAPVAAPEPPCGIPGGTLRIGVLTKCDLLHGDGRPFADRIPVSAKTGAGLDRLKSEIAARLWSIIAADGDAAPEERTIAAYIETRKAIAPLVSRPDGESAPDLVLAANAVRAAAEKLGVLAGATYSEDLLESLFSRFCVGK